MLSASSPTPIPSPAGEGRGRKLGPVMAIALVMGNMIGSGVFLLPASLAPYGWNAVAGWVVTIGGALCLAYVLARLTAATPVGPAELIEQEFGPLAGFLIGFAFWVSVWSGCVTIAVAAVSYGSSFLPVLGTNPALSTLGVIWAVTLVNLAGTRRAGALQLATTIVKLIPLVVVAALIAMVLGKSGGAALTPFPDEGLSLSQTNAAAALTLWAMVGFEAACAASGKIENPRRNVPRATLIGAGLTGLFYLIVCSGIALMLPASQVAGSNAPFALFVAQYWNSGAAAWIAVFAAISALGAVNGWVLVQGEVPLDMARRRMMPSWFGRTWANGVPANGLIAASLLASLLVLANASRSMAGLFTFMALLTTSVTLWLYLACACAAIKRRIAVPAAIAGLVFGVWSLIGAGWLPSLLSVVLMLSGLPLYWWARRSSLPISERSASTS